MTVKRSTIKGQGLRDQRREAGWLYEDTFDVPGKRYKLIKRREFKVRGERGAHFRFHEVVTDPNGNISITAFGGPKHHGQWRSFRPEAITTVLKALPR